MSVSVFDAVEPYLLVSNVLAVPIMRPSRTGDQESAVFTGTLAFVMTVGILLERYLDLKYEGRSLADDQAGVYEAVASKLKEQFGVDGRACVLRFICELQQRQLGRATVAGILLTILFTPRAGTGEGQRYLAAKGLGCRKDAPCASHYGSCPFSVFLYFEGLQNLTTTTT